MRWAQKDPVEGLLWIAEGRSFQTLGAAILKPRAPKEVQTKGGGKVTIIRRLERAGMDISIEKSKWTVPNN